MTALATAHGSTTGKHAWRRGVAWLTRHLLVVLLVLAGPNLVASAAQAEELSLDTVRKGVVADYPSVRQISSAGLTNMLAPRGSGKHSPVALFDVREPGEFEVSHLKGARLVDPGIWASTFMTRFGGDLKGKTVVFYCSVGVRSSQMAEALRARLTEAGVVRVYNLDGGIFGWHNEQRPLVTGSAEKPVPTDLVHPYDDKWGSLLNRQQFISYKPAGS